MKKEMVELLAPYTEEGRQKIMAEVGEHYCLLCWTVLNGRKCHCDPVYDV